MHARPDGLPARSSGKDRPRVVRLRSGCESRTLRGWSDPAAGARYAAL